MEPVNTSLDSIIAIVLESRSCLASMTRLSFPGGDDLWDSHEMATHDSPKG